LGLFLKFRIKRRDAFRADAVGKFGFGMLLDITFQPIPITGIISNFFAIRANGQ
jgi:hypothetical protein